MIPTQPTSHLAASATPDRPIAAETVLDAHLAPPASDGRFLHPTAGCNGWARMAAALAMAIVGHGACAGLIVAMNTVSTPNMASSSSILLLDLVAVAEPSPAAPDSTPTPSRPSAVAAIVDEVINPEMAPTDRSSGSPPEDRAPEDQRHTTIAAIAMAPAEMASANDIIPEKLTQQHAPREKPHRARSSARDSAASRATAPPKQTNRRKRASGSGTDAAQASNTYAALIASHLQRFKTSPAHEPRTGRVTVVFHLDRAGRLTSARVSSGGTASGLREAALATVRRASPFPAPPKTLTHLSFAVPIHFDMR